MMEALILGVIGILLYLIPFMNERNCDSYRKLIVLKVIKYIGLGLLVLGIIHITIGHLPELFYVIVGALGLLMLLGALLGLVDVVVGLIASMPTIILAASIVWLICKVLPGLSELIIFVNVVLTILAIIVRKK